MRTGAGEGLASVRTASPRIARGTVGTSMGDVSETCHASSDVRGAPGSPITYAVIEEGNAVSTPRRVTVYRRARPSVAAGVNSSENHTARATGAVSTVVCPTHTPSAYTLSTSPGASGPVWGMTRAKSRVPETQAAPRAVESGGM